MRRELLPKQLAVLRIILFIWTCRCPIGWLLLGMQYLHINLMNTPEVEESPNTPAKLMNLYEIFRMDCKVSSPISLPIIAFIISNMVL